MKNNNNNLMKNEKKKILCRKIELGYCPNNIVRKFVFVLQGWIVLQPRQLGRAEIVL